MVFTRTDHYLFNCIIPSLPPSALSLHCQPMWSHTNNHPSIVLQWAAQGITHSRSRPTTSNWLLDHNSIACFSYKSPLQPFFSWCCFGISDIASANCVCMFCELPLNEKCNAIVNRLSVDGKRHTIVFCSKYASWLMINNNRWCHLKNPSLEGFLVRGWSKPYAIADLTKIIEKIL